MGVAGLWEVLRPAGQVRSLTELAVTDGFNANPSHQRAFRIGIDASIWFFHAAYGREGENPELRTLFFRCCRLLQAPLLPLFVFDGPNRPAIKRGKRVGGNAHWLTQGMKNIIEAFGFEWRVAPGEAEAELAYLNRVGVIDAVLSDDVDNFLFGATMVIRNPSSTLSGNRAHPVKNAQGKDDGNHVMTYKTDDIFTHSSVGLSCSGTILIGLLSGGDYIPAGLPGCGQKFATGLARAGFGDSLVNAVKELKGSELDAFLGKWRQDIRTELKTNKSGCLPSKKPSLAASLPNDFPSLPVLLSYVEPITSENTPSPKGRKKKPLPVVWRNDPDPMRIASICELYFEWGVKDVIIRRFRTVLWPGVVCRAVRRTVVEDDRCRCPTRHTRNEDEDVDDTDPSSPTKRVASTLSTLNLSSPSKKSSAGPSSSESSASPPFSLSTLVPLTPTTSSPPSSPTSSDSGPSSLLLEILSHRAHASTDSTPEYRVLVDPTTLVERAESGVKGIRPPLVGGLFGIDPEEEEETGGGDETGDDEDAGGIERLETAAAAASKSGVKKRKPAQREAPTTPLRLWLPACMIQAVAPALVEAYEEKAKAREEKKAKRGKKGGAGASTKGTGRKAKAKEVGVEEDGDADVGDDKVPGPSTSLKTTSARSRGKPKAVIGGRRRKPKQVSEAQDEAYELIDLSAGESPCSSDEEGDTGSKKGKGKARVGVTAAKKTTKQGTSAPTKNTVKDFYKVTKSGIRANASKPGASTSSLANPSSTGHVAAAKRVPLYAEDQEEESDDAYIPTTTRATASKPSISRPLGPAGGVPRYEEEDDPPPTSLPKSTRPLDVLRARSNAGSSSTSASSTSTSNSKRNATSRPIYEEEEEEEPGLPPSSLSRSKSNTHHPPQSVQPTIQAKKRPAFVDVSDTDSDTEVRDVRRPPSSNIPTAVEPSASGAVNAVDGTDADKSVGSRKATSTLISERRSAKAADADGVIDLIARAKDSKTASAPTTSATTSVCLASEPFRRPSPATVASSSSSVPGLSIGPKGPRPIARSTSKLAHILLPSAVESEGEEEGELPTFHQGSTKSPAKSKGARPGPQPFPMQLPSESFVSPSRAMKITNLPREASDDEVEIIDVFMTPRGESPPRSPTPSPSVVKPRPVHASAGPSMGVQSKDRRAFPSSPTKSHTQTSQTETSVVHKAKQRRRPSTDSDVQSPRKVSDGILKSPRKSAEHTHPRQVPRSRASSPTPLADSGSTYELQALGNGNVDADTDATLCLSANRQAGSGRTSLSRRPQPNEESAIYISSGSEDEAGVEDSDQHRGGGGVVGEAEVETAAGDETDTVTDLDLDGRADTGMILSAPPSPAPSVSVETVEAAPKCPSKFKPALAPSTSKVNVCPPSAEPRASDASLLKSSGISGVTGKTTPQLHPTSSRRLPLLVARSKHNVGTDDIIDLTSD